MGKKQSEVWEVLISVAYELYEGVPVAVNFLKHGTDHQYVMMGSVQVMTFDWRRSSQWAISRASRSPSL